MNPFIPLWHREFLAGFRMHVASSAAVLFLLVTGSGFWMLMVRLARAPSEARLAADLFSSPFYWLAMLLVPPLLTMRLFAEERRTGTLETLMTAPVTETQVVLAKFAGAYSVLVLLWLPTLLYSMLLRWSGGGGEGVAWEGIGTGFLGSALLGAYLVSFGLFCSLLARHAIIAAISSLALPAVLLLAEVSSTSVWLEGIAWLSPLFSLSSHMADFAAGVVDSRAVVWYGGATFLLLFISIRILEARRLR